VTARCSPLPRSSWRIRKSAIQSREKSALRCDNCSGQMRPPLPCPLLQGGEGIDTLPQWWSPKPLAAILRTSYIPVVAKETQSDVPRENREGTRGHARSFWTFWISPILAIIYVLSIGPAAWLHQKGIISEPIGLYTPVVGIASYSPRLWNVLNWYVEDVWHCGVPGVRY
jgi:hypothetical protein